MKRTLVVFITFFSALNYMNAQMPETNSWYETPEALIVGIYKEVSATADEAVDWEKVRSMFIDEAVVILRTGPDESKQFSADGFIQDFRDFYQYPEVQASGFEEKIESMKSMVYKDIAFIATVYTAAITGREAPPTRGIDLWLLCKKDGFWKITSVINEVIPAGQDLPDEPEWRF